LVICIEKKEPLGIFSGLLFDHPVNRVFKVTCGEPPVLYSAHVLEKENSNAKDESK
jgi:hypothetical protein